jgi:hypothetical protein
VKFTVIVITIATGSPLSVGSYCQRLIASIAA